MLGVRFIQTEMVGDPWDDWSAVRSPSRARRRMKKHPQRIVRRYRANGKVLQDKVHNVVYIHPHDYIKLQAVIPPRQDWTNPW